MPMSKLKAATAMLLVVSALAGAVAWHASTRAEEKGRLDAGFRLAVDEVIADDSTLVTRIDIETPPDSTVKVVADKPNRGGFIDRTPDRDAGPSRTQLVIFADHTEWKYGSTNTLKFIMKLRSLGTAAMGDTGPMPEGKTLGDVVKVFIRAGEYPYGEPTKLVSLRDVTYSLLVTKRE